INFSGFYDGDGQGGGDAQHGDVWKMRFMPNEVGTWKYVYWWSDGTKGGSGTFECVSKNAGKGILQPYKKNPHWLAYNGTDPVWVKSYYETGHGAIGQDFNWIVDHVYQPLIDHGYNHLQVNWLLSLCCFHQYYLDGPKPDTFDLTLYKEGKVEETMSLNVWHRMEKQMAWLNQNDVGVHMFLGVDGSKNDGPAWAKLSDDQKDFFVRYMVARLAPFANLAGWNYVWEVPGNREDQELGFARLVAKYDIFNHLRTYEDEFPRENNYNLPEYSFAAIENHEIAAPDKNLERNLWKEPWTHHMACLLGYEGKPVYMTEGNALWRRFWSERTGATQEDLRRSAWACATAGASFTWNGHAKEYELYAGGPDGLPFNDENPYKKSEKYIRILADVMNHEVDFYRMKPHDELLSGCPALQVYALAEPGNQYLVFAPDGEAFNLKLEPGNYSCLWMDTKTGEKQSSVEVQATDDPVKINFAPPSSKTDWALILRKKE
ncbi:MAG TPA: DUF5060 domain-containing protein, partial [Sunxiuqinia sp.]|nr:DUF5060 domain-containing protein [Sunxiuqinia sp.]